LGEEVWEPLKQFVDVCSKVSHLTSKESRGK